MSHDHAVHVVIPVGRSDASVVDVDQLLAYLNQGDSLEDAITNGGMDSFEQRHAVEHLNLIRRLNETGDATAYWKARDDL